MRLTPGSISEDNESGLVIKIYDKRKPKHVGKSITQDGKITDNMMQKIKQIFQMKSEKEYDVCKNQIHAQICIKFNSL